MSGYLALVEATGQLGTLQDEEFVATLQLLARVGAVSFWGRVVLPRCSFWRVWEQS